ncbi:MAG: hypothetical protein IPM82_25530 [Saprospiraceae bacterium]|nr:hypothetical protein [Saprospiraceae bacterium]
MPQATYLYSLTLAPNGNIIVTGQYKTYLDKAIMLELDISGNVQWAKTYDGGGSFFFLKKLGFLASGNIVVGGYSDMDSLVFLQLSPEGEPVFGKKYSYETTENKGFSTANALLPLEDGFLIGTGIQNKTPPSFTFDKGGILKTDLSGNLLWAKSYRDTTYGITDFVDGILRATDGSIWVNFSDIYHYNTQNTPPGWYNADTAPSFAIIDNDGNILWNKDYGDPTVSWQKQDFNFMSDSALVVVSEAFGIELMKLTRQGEGDCRERPLSIIVEDIQIGLNDFIMTVDTVAVQLIDFDLPVKDALVRSYNVCCDSLPDMDIYDAFLYYPCPDRNVVWLEICNNGVVPYAQDSLQIAVYDADPYKVAATLLDTFRLGELPNPGNDCKLYDIEVPISTTNELFFVLNPPAGLSPPFDPIYGFMGVAVPECDYYNNKDSIRLSIYDTVLDLGPDTILCPGDSLTLSESYPFLLFAWSDGSTDSLFTANELGTYWLEAVDRCGVVQRDSIMVDFDIPPSFDIGFDSITVCQDDSVYLKIPSIFKAYKWGDNVCCEFDISCDTCAGTLPFPIIIL